MKNSNDGFIKGRLRSLTFAFKGIYLLSTTEDSIKTQLFLGFIATSLGFYFNISITQWLIQCLVIGIVLVAEALNTAVEKIADFIHPDYHEKIGFIKRYCCRFTCFCSNNSTHCCWYNLHS